MKTITQSITYKALNKLQAVIIFSFEQICVVVRLFSPSLQKSRPLVEDSSEKQNGSVKLRGSEPKRWENIIKLLVKKF